jgi:two-component system phosphate regulon sensor histidine kinase PhoR
LSVLKSRFFWKLYAGYAALVLLAVVTVGVLVARRITDDTVTEIEDALHAQAVLLRDLATPALQGTADPSFPQRIRDLGAAVGTRLTVIRADGIVVADSDQDPAGMDNHGSRPEVLAARVEGRGTATRFSRTVAANLMYVAVRVSENAGLLGYARAAVPLTVIRERLAALRGMVVLGAAVAAVFALGIGLVVARRVTARLASLTAAAEAIAAGDYQRRVEGASEDELGALAAAFNRMAGQLEARMQTITEDRSKLLTILGGMVEGVIAVDPDERVVHLNAAAGRILGVSPVESVGRPIWQVTRVRKVSEAIDETLHGAREVTGELQLDADAADRIVELHGAPLKNGQGGLVGAVLVLHEVTELRRLETVRQDFVANVSHELKTPITAIRGLIETIVEDPEMPEETQARFLAKIHNQASRLSLLVTDLLTLARLESAAGALESEPLDLRDPVEASVKNLRPEAKERGVGLHWEPPGEPVRTLGDAEALELVVNNLLDNALKYTPEGGRIWVRVLAADDAATLEVEDTGIGIAREHHDRIFERFYRVDKARSRELGGTGLGLSIVKHVCRAHGGNIAVESAPASGSSFRVRLPLAPATV